METTLRYIEEVDELNARWSEVWALMGGLHQLHADLLKKDLCPGREEWAHTRIETGLERGDYWLLVIEQDSEIVGIGTASFQPEGKT